MSTYLFLLGTTFLVMAGCALLINFCRRHVGRTRHGLTGMCHSSGGSVCGCCASQLRNKTAPADRQSPPARHC